MPLCLMDSAGGAQIAQTHTRLEWSAVPESVRVSIEDLVGARIVTAENQSGGFSPGPAARCVLSNGDHVFIKAAGLSLNPDSPAMHRREGTVMSIMPQGVAVPHLRAVHDDGDWVALIFDEIDGHMPRLPWIDDEWQTVLRLFEDLSSIQTDSAQLDTFAEHYGHITSWNDWESVADDINNARVPQTVRSHIDQLVTLGESWTDASAGNTLLHCDLRADNILLTASGPIAVDWASATRGAAFIDAVGFLPSAHLNGAPRPSQVFPTMPLSKNVARDQLLPVLSALAAYFVSASLQPAPKGIPTVRAFQEAQGRVVCDWIADLQRWAH